MGDFDTLSDLLSEGSNDSFFDEPGNIQKSKLKPSERKQSVSDLFNLGGNLDDEKPTLATDKPDIPKTPKKDDWLGVEATKNHTTKTTEVIKPAEYFEDTNPLVRESTKSSKKLILTELFGNDDAQKPPMFDDILSDVKVKPKKSTAEVSKETPETIFKDTRPPRVPRSGLIDPLGLFSEDSKPTRPPREREVTFSKPETTKNPPARLPDWLDGKSETKLELSKPETAIVKAEQSVSGTYIQESEFTDDSAVMSKKNMELDLTDSATTIHQHLATSQMQFQNTSLALQQQEHQVITALQMKRYEDSLTDMKKQQQLMLEKQEQQFKRLIDRQLAKQQIMENQLRVQQERINQHLQTLLVQPGCCEDGLEVTGGGDTARGRRRKDEIEFLEESYTKRIQVLEEAFKTRENQFRTELTTLTENYESKIKQIEDDYREQISRHKTNLKQINEQHILEVDSLKEIHSRVVDEINHEYSQLFENLKRAKQSEIEVVENATVYTQQLEHNLLVLDDNSKLLTELNRKFEHDRGVFAVAKEERLRRKEDEINLLRAALEKSRESTENERTQLLTLVRTLETKLAQNSHEAQEQKLALQVAASTFSARTTALDRETEFNRTLLERERTQLETLKETILAEQERNVQQITEEKLRLRAERMKLETALKLNARSSHEWNRAEIEAAIAVAQEAAELTDREREKLLRRQQELERTKRILKDRENALANGERELSVLTQTANARIEEAEKATTEAKFVEVNYNERLKELKMQFASLREREGKLAAEKIFLSRERLSLHTLAQKKKSCSLCAIEDVPVSGRMDFGHIKYARQDDPEILTVLDPDIIRLQLEVEEDGEFK